MTAETATSDRAATPRGLTHGGMIELSDNAAAQVGKSVADGATMALRVAAQRLDDGSLHYVMGFDDVGGEDDLSFSSNGITIVISRASYALCGELLIDFATLDDGNQAFVFLPRGQPT